MSLSKPQTDADKFLEMWKREEHESTSDEEFAVKADNLNVKFSFTSNERDLNRIERKQREQRRRLDRLEKRLAELQLEEEHREKCEEGLKCISNMVEKVEQQVKTCESTTMRVCYDVLKTLKNTGYISSKRQQEELVHTVVREYYLQSDSVESDESCQTVKNGDKVSEWLKSMQSLTSLEETDI